MATKHFATMQAAIDAGYRPRSAMRGFTSVDASGHHKRGDRFALYQLDPETNDYLPGGPLGFTVEVVIDDMVNNGGGAGAYCALYPPAVVEKAERARSRAAAAVLGRRGGSATSDAKAQTARNNGRTGGRPRRLGGLVIRLGGEDGPEAQLQIYLRSSGLAFRFGGRGSRAPMKELRCIDPAAPSTADASYVARSVEDLLEQIGRDGHWTDPHAEVLASITAALRPKE